MAGPLDRDGWVKKYVEVEFDLPITMVERHPMLPPKSHPKDVLAPPSPTFHWPTTTTSTESRLPKSSSTSALPHGDPPQLARISTLMLSTLAIPSLAASGKPLPVDLPKSGTGMTTADLFSSSGQPLTPQLPPHPSLAPPGSSAPIVRISRSFSSPKVFPSPLKHQHTTSTSTSTSMPFPSPFTRPGSRTSFNFSRIASEEARAFCSGMLSTTNSPGGVLGSSNSNNPPTTNRASMILYRKADPFSSSHAINLSNPNSGANTPVSNSRPQSLRSISAVEDGFPPPTFSHRQMCSTSGDSIVSLVSDSKYPLLRSALERGFIAYSFDPEEEDDSIEDDEIDWLHDPEPTIAAKLASNAHGRSRVNLKRPHSSSLSWRGFINFGVLLLLFIAILAFFVASFI